MLKKELYLSKISQLQGIAKKYGVSSNILNKLEKCTSEIESFTLKVLFVGKFNAGKSALINTIVNRDLLIEEQKPETAIASEIVYGEKEFVELYDNEGNVTTCSLEEISSYEADKYNHFTYHINNELLRKYRNYTIVDMPGFNSGLERHNKAIMQYAAQGNAYILVVDCEEGEIKSSGLEFIREIKQYENNIAIAVSKADKKPESQVKDVVNKVAATASGVFNREVRVVPTSKFDEDIEGKLDSILKAFDIEDLFEQKFEPQIVELGKLIYAAIESVARTASFDDSEIEREIARRQRAKVKLVEQLEKERKKLSQKMKNQVRPSIISDVQSALQMNSSALASSIMSGGDSFTRTVNNIIRPVLISSTKRYTEESFQEFIEEMDLSEIFAEDNSEQIAQEITNKYVEVGSKLKVILNNVENAKGIYKTIMGALAITTSVVAPWIEIILVFLPDILKLIGVLNQSSQMDSLRRKVENEIIPQIISKMSLEIEKSLQSLENEMIEEVEEKINTLIEVEAEALNIALNMKNSKKLEYELLLKDIQADLDEVQEVISSR